MTKIIYILYFLSFLPSCNLEKKEQIIPSSDLHDARIELSEKTKHYEDKKISFNLPENWNIDVTEATPQSFYTLIAPTTDPTKKFTFNICIETAHPYLSGMNKDELISIYNSNVNAKNYEVIHSEIVTLSTKESAFYLVQKENVSSKHKASFFFPVGRPSANYSVMGNYELSDSISYQLVNSKLIDIVKSIKIKKK